MSLRNSLLTIISLGLFITGYPVYARDYTPDELIVLNGVGGYGDVGFYDVDHAMAAPDSTNGFP